ncbi:S-layer homology domain-containing protein [Lysinibacillus sp. NPDC094403]
MIEDIAARGIITGYPDCTFRPNALVEDSRSRIINFYYKNE